MRRPPGHARLKPLSERREGKGAKRRAHVSVNAHCKSAVGTLRFGHPTFDCLT